MGVDASNLRADERRDAQLKYNYSLARRVNNAVFREVTTKTYSLYIVFFSCSFFFADLLKINKFHEKTFLLQNSLLVSQTKAAGINQSVRLYASLKEGF